MPARKSELPHSYTPEEWRQTAIVFFACIVTQYLSFEFLPPTAFLLPASAVALAGLYFGSLRLWPGILAGGMLAAVLSHGTPSFLYIVPIAQTLQAVLGAYLLTKASIDPLFRRYRDIFYVTLTILLVSIVMPFLLLFSGEPLSLSWFHTYVANVFMYLATLPFLLRWIAKPSFRRPLAESIETVIVFAVLVTINALIFSFEVTEVAGVLMFYFLLIPLFWIAIRLRPRFITLAVIITSVFVLGSVFGSGFPYSLLADLFSAEVFLIVLSLSFYIVVSLEEERRVSTNLMRNQLATLENAVSRISSESQAKNDFIAILAHELRNPLAPVMSGIEFLKLTGGFNAEAKKTFGVMETSMQTVRRLLDDLLDVSRISEGKIAMDRQTCNLNDILERSMVSTAHHFKERHQNLEYKPSRAKLLVAGDPVRLVQIFSNLLTNASKYSDSGDSIELSVRKDGTSALVEITDEGVGIAPEALSTVFLPFHQLDQGARSKKGLGIGLALVQSFVEMHGGTVHAVSQGVGRGSVFTVRLPLAAAAQASAEIVEPVRKSRKRTGPNVLVVDDNDAAAAGIGRLLELQGCHVSYAYEGAQAIEMAARADYEVILLDIGLQDMDGYTVARQLRTSGYAGLLVALSGYSTPDAQQKGEAAGFDHYLVKPAGLAELKKVIPGIG